MEQRSTSRPISADDLVVGLIRSPHGLRGEVKVESQTDVEGRFRKGARLLCDDIGEIVVASVRGPADVPIIRFEGFASRRDADRLRGKRLRDRKSTRLNSSHLVISYAVFCLKKKMQRITTSTLEALQRAASGLREDYAAVKAGVTLPSSTSPVDGHITRLQLVKRTTFGTAHP